MDQFDRTIKLIGKENFNKLSNASIAIFGIGGVGSYTLEALVRVGIGHIDIFDRDIVDVTNINRQIIALHSTIGQDKVEVAKQRALDINPKLTINTYKMFYDKESANQIDLSKYDYVIDAIDTVSSKIELIKQANNKNIKIISSMGTGKKLEPTMLEVSDIYNTTVCPLAKVLRKELRKEGIKSLKVVYSKEEPKQNEENITSSISFVPSVAGLIIASEVVKDLIEL